MTILLSEQIKTAKSFELAFENWICQHVKVTYFGPARRRKIPRNPKIFHVDAEGFRGGAQPDSVVSGVWLCHSATSYQYVIYDYIFHVGLAQRTPTVQRMP